MWKTSRPRSSKKARHSLGILSVQRVETKLMLSSSAAPRRAFIGIALYNTSAHPLHSRSTLLFLFLLLRRFFVTFIFPCYFTFTFCFFLFFCIGRSRLFCFIPELVLLFFRFFPGNWSLSRIRSFAILLYLYLLWMWKRCIHAYLSLGTPHPRTLLHPLKVSIPNLVYVLPRLVVGKFVNGRRGL